MSGFHAWIVVKPVETDDPDDETMGVQVQIDAPKRTELRYKVFTHLHSMGATLDEDIGTLVYPDDAPVNVQLPLYSVENPSYPTGLTVECYPCSETGTNIDQGALEPRAE